jgi:putative ABC transport system permease protein
MMHRPSERPFTSLRRPLLMARIAWHELGRNALRSSLTALGIVIGVASVVLMVAVGNGARQRIESQVAALGQNMLGIFAGSHRSGAAHWGMGTASTFTLADAEALRREIPAIVALSPEVVATVQVFANGRNWSTMLVGESSEFLQIRDWKLKAGGGFGEREVRSAAKVALLGSATAQELFGPLNPVGQTLRIKNIPFVIAGVLESKGAGMGGHNQDDRVVVPYTTAMRRITGDKFLRSASVQVFSPQQMQSVQKQITGLLRQRHRLGPGREDDFSIFNQKEIADTVSSVTRIVTLLLGSISGISLLVGGIGIMNIMLVSVTERTREIGIRMAVGARPGDIRLQFLLEAVALSFLGGVAGVALGMGGSRMVGLFLDFNGLVSPSSVFVAFGVSFAIGVFFGFYPARKAAALNPIAALRYE